MRVRARLLLPMCLLLYPVVGLPAQDVQSDSNSPGSWLNASPPPGAYRTDQAVEFSTDSRGTLEYRFAGTGHSDFVPYEQSLTLTALDGEERSFTVNVTLKTDGAVTQRATLSYIIDKRAPPVPVPSIAPGTYDHDISLIFPLQEGATIHAWVDGGKEQKWTGNPLLLSAGTSGEREHTVYAYSVDSAGNSSVLGEYRYLVSSPKPASPDFQIISPVAGKWANRQLLYIRSSGYTDIRYTVDGSNPGNGTPYTGPVLIPGTGHVVLRVSATPLQNAADGRRAVPVVRQVVFDQGDSAGPVTAPQRGYEKALSIPPPKQPYRMARADSTVQPEFLPFTEAIHLGALSGTIRAHILRLLPADSTSGELPFRYCFVIDARTTAAPLIQVDGKAALDGRPRISILAAPGNSIFYTTDGSEPDSAATPYRGPFYPDGEQSPIVLKARALNELDGRWSTTTTSAVRMASCEPSGLHQKPLKWPRSYTSSW